LYNHPLSNQGLFRVKIRRIESKMQAMKERDEAETGAIRKWLQLTFGHGYTGSIWDGTLKKLPQTQCKQCFWWSERVVGPQRLLVDCAADSIFHNSYLPLLFSSTFATS
jgi:hypothetical protein